MRADRRLPRRPEALAEHYRAAGAWGETTIGAELSATAARCPGRVAVVDAERRLTYAELDRQTTAVALGLLDRGLRPGDAVVVQSGNVVETLVGFYGLLKAGLVPVCSLPQHGRREVSDLITLTGARAHLIQADWPRADLPALAASLAADEHIQFTITVQGSTSGGVALADLITHPPGPLPEVDAEDLAVLQLSGGTTGTPKLIPRLHCDYLCNARAWARRWGWDEHNVAMHALPVMHNAGLALCVLPALLTGATVVLAPRADAEVIAGLIERERVTDMVANATVAYRLLESDAARSADLGSLARLTVGPQTPEYAHRLESELGIRALGVFGMGEGMIMCTPWDAPADVRRTTVGTPIHPLDEVRILDDDLADVAPGEIGELACRGPYTIPGYYAAAEHNAVAFTPDGFFRTGDLARAQHIDGTTFYSIEGRIKDNVNRGGEKIHADELERLLVTHPGVAEVAVVGMPDPELGERVCAYIVPREDGPAPTVADLAEFLLGKGIAKFKLPERVEVRWELPVTSIRKVAKKRLREDIAAKLAQERQARVTPR
ncbi:(2,3-dihydroxybenzoyl)adenylate synthase [Amycolatopsis sp. K13G38]|uniref:(2,3-dihydroxybenzoyl)adenylate synthase n=1 Tax=Amycolatopsis acididurans TaxID=2724524 RepID=A0ABX1J1Z5_9PSEU|nr:AMP-binding protein [Amycolatopsis acididurans]NKQ52375.1 (2,3-dihydroxybenzoyl)adenylate synthase [Amycolatopsis acididurans]